MSASSKDKEPRTARGYISYDFGLLTLSTRPQNGDTLATVEDDGARALLDRMEDGDPAPYAGGTRPGYINAAGEWRLQGNDRLIAIGAEWTAS